MACGGDDMDLTDNGGNKPVGPAERPDQPEVITPVDSTDIVTPKDTVSTETPKDSINTDVPKDSIGSDTVPQRETAGMSFDKNDWQHDDKDDGGIAQ